MNAVLTGLLVTLLAGLSANGLLTWERSRTNERQIALNQARFMEFAMERATVPQELAVLKLEIALIKDNQKTLTSNQETMMGRQMKIDKKIDVLLGQHVKMIDLEQEEDE